MIGRTNCSAGGGGGLSDTSAILRVSAPTGSTVTLTRGGITKTSTGHPNAADASQNDYYFVIPQSAFSSTAWTVTATYAGKTDTQTVVINAADEYDVLMSYDFFLVRNGVMQNSVTLSSITVSGTVTAATITDENGYKKCVLPSNSGVVFSQIDYTQFSTLYLDAGITRGQYFNWAYVGFDSVATWKNNYTDMNVYEHFTSWFPRGLISFDLAGNPSNKNLFNFYSSASSSSGFDLNIYNVYCK